MRTLTVDELFEVSAGLNGAACANTVLAWSGMGGLVGASGGVIGGEVGFVAGGFLAQEFAATCR